MCLGARSSPSGRRAIAKMRDVIDTTGGRRGEGTRGRGLRREVMSVLIHASAWVVLVSCGLLFLGHVAAGVQARRERLLDLTLAVAERAGEAVRIGDLRTLEQLVDPLTTIDGFVGAAVCLPAAASDVEPSARSTADCLLVRGRMAAAGAGSGRLLDDLLSGRITAASPVVRIPGDPPLAWVFLDSDLRSLAPWVIAGLIVVAGATLSWVVVTWRVGLWMQRRFVDPIAALVSLARKVAEEGATVTRADLYGRSSGELGELERSFGAMLEAIQRDAGKIERQRDLLERIMETSPAGLVVVDGQGSIVWASATARDALELEGSAEDGWQPPAGRWLDASGEDTVGESEPLSLLLRVPGFAGDTIRGRWTYEGPSGRRRALLVHGLPWSDEVGASGAILAVADVERERLLEEQLVQSQKMEAVGRLAGGVAHDFNNVLTAIVGFTQILSAQMEENEEALASVREIETAARRGADLTSQLLTFSRKRRGPSEMLEIDKHLGRTEAMLRRIIGESVELVTSFGSPNRAVRIDPAQLDQIVLNLAINGRDAMTDGGRIEISTDGVSDWVAGFSRTTAGQWVRLRVRDHGCGMSPDVRSRVFEPFFTTKEEGSGLGLSTVYGIVHSVDGRIRVESEPGEGTVFEVLLPASRIASRSAEAPDSPDRAVVGGAEGACSPTVLLAEDDGGVRSLVTRMLESKGYRVLAASSGTKALSLAREYAGRIDLLITDIVMPDLRGPELRRRLEEARPDIPVIFISGYADASLWREALSRGRALFLQKPFRPSALAEKVSEILDAEGAA